MIDEPTHGKELDYATSARIGFAAMQDRIKLMMNRNRLCSDDWEDIAALRDMYVRSDVVRYKFLDDLTYAVRDMLEDESREFTLIEWQTVYEAYGKTLLMGA